MTYELLPDLETLLAPETLTWLTGRPVQIVSSTSVELDNSVSGNQFLLVETDNAALPLYLVKRISAKWDWVTRATNDHLGRTARLWQYGWLDRLARPLGHPIIACAQEDSGWAILMRKVPAKTLQHYQMTEILDVFVLKMMARLHATYWESPGLDDLALGLCPLSAYLTFLSAETGYKERSVENSDGPRRLVEGWEILLTLLAPDVAEVVQELMANPQPLVSALRRYPQTLNHGDIRLANFCLSPARQPTQIILIDWQLATMAPPTLDLGWYIGFSFPLTKDRAIQVYHHHLAEQLGPRFDKSLWQPMLELGLLGSFLHQCCFRAYDAIHDPRDEYRQGCLEMIRWWHEPIRAAVRWL